MLEHLQRHATNRLLRNFSEHRVAQFGEQCRRESQQSIPDQQKHRHHQHRLRLIQSIYNLLEQQRYADIRQLRDYQAEKRKPNASAVIPQIGCQRTQHRESTGRFIGGGGEQSRCVGTGVIAHC